MNGTANSPRLTYAQEVKPNSSLSQATAATTGPACSPLKGGGPADAYFAYRDPRLPANWWVSVEQVGGELRYGFHSPAGDWLRSPSEVAHYLQACVG